MKMNLKFGVLAVAALMLAATSVCYAEGDGAAQTTANGVGNLIKLPVTLMKKAATGIEHSAAASAKNDVANAPVYSLDASAWGGG